MQLFSGRTKEHRSGGGGGDKCQAAATSRHRSGKCRSLCCGASRLSVSSSASCSSADAAPEPPLPLPPPQPRGLSKLAHGMVQARLQSMIDAASEAARPPPAPRRAPNDELAERYRHCGLPRARARGGGGCCYDEKQSGGRHREQAAVAARRTACVVLLAEDPRTHDPWEEFRQSIAEAFHEVCSALFSCKPLR
ncbi:hypothetical protein BAE44_0013520 [Dichanthelium oligosanthes]|uniref:Uncharacterized protein n=1 Tax=Dichanthelium oligosanthes TaxID=888268 RepID=A0A1E5VK10_9POAL|nr:hypothetical protein BAE44_0013520 [Dichanthelium oligosanthes]